MTRAETCWWWNRLLRLKKRVEAEVILQYCICIDCEAPFTCCCECTYLVDRLPCWQGFLASKKILSFWQQVRKAWPVEHLMAMIYIVQTGMFSPPSATQSWMDRSSWVSFCWDTTIWKQDTARLWCNNSAWNRLSGRYLLCIYQSNEQGIDVNTYPNGKKCLLSGVLLCFSRYRSFYMYRRVWCRSCTRRFNGADLTHKV